MASWFADPAMVGRGMPPTGSGTCPLAAPAAGSGMPDCCADGYGMVF
jgi:hypothetical protein